MISSHRLLEILKLSEKATDFSNGAHAWIIFNTAFSASIQADDVKAMIEELLASREVINDLMTDQENSDRPMHVHARAHLSKFSGDSK